MKIIIPSKGRPNNKAIQALKKERPHTNFFIVIRDTELSMYAPFLQDVQITILVMEDKPGIDDAVTRNFGLNYIKQHYPKEQFVGFMDDDIMRIKGKTILGGFDQLLFDIQMAQAYEPTTWIMSAKQDAPFMERNAIYINRQTVWVGFCLIDVTKMPKDLFQSTLIHGPQEVSIPVVTLREHKSFASTTNVLFYADDSLKGGLSDIYHTESRELREQAFQNTTYSKYIALRKSKSANAMLSRCNLLAVYKDYPCNKMTIFNYISPGGQE